MHRRYKIYRPNTTVTRKKKNQTRQTPNRTRRSPGHSIVTEPVSERKEKKSIINGIDLYAGGDLLHGLN